MFVYIHKTDLAGYSADWLTENMPESRALGELRHNILDTLGLDLFAANIKPGDRVVIKPNLVRHWHPEGKDLYALITHPALIKAVVDEVYTQLQGRGTIIIADAPMADTDFSELLKITGLDRLPSYYRQKYDFKLEIRDLRKYRYTFKSGPHGYGHEVRQALGGDPEGYTEINLGDQSAFARLDHTELLQGTDIARRAETIQNHTPQTNKYLIANTILNADVLISMPKLKTHGKVGVTLNSKGMVGINGDKNYLPHFRWGSATEGGDQHPAGSVPRSDAARMRLGRLVADKLIARQQRWADGLVWLLQNASGLAARGLRLRPVTPLLVNGDWPGNDTCWRLPADLMRVALFADAHGRLQAQPQRRFISIVDGITGGEGNGPLKASPKPAGVLLAGTHPVAVDLVGARLMGFDPARIKQLYELSQGIATELEPSLGRCDPGAINLISNYHPWQALLTDPQTEDLGFEAPSRWQNQIEIEHTPLVVS